MRQIVILQVNLDLNIIPYLDPEEILITYYSNAEELLTFLQKEFEDDTQKVYELIDSTKLDKAREAEEEGLPIAGCQKARMIYFACDWSYKVRRYLCSCEFFIIGNFEFCKFGHAVNVKMFTPFEEEEDQLDETEGFQVSNAYTFVEEQTYIGLYSSAHFEIFYLFFETKKL